MTEMLQKSEENSHPFLRTSPLTLQKLASMKIAQCIWLKNAHKETPNEKLPFPNNLQLCSDCDTLTNVPRKIRKMIESCFNPISMEMNLWCTNAPTILDRLGHDYIRNRLNFVVFGGNGTVHYDDTIANFFLDDSISNVSKFKFACLYCVEEKIDFFWPLVSDQFSIGDVVFCTCNLRSCKNFLMHYWICRKRGNLSKIPFQGFSSVEFLMISMCEQSDIWIGIKYFLSWLDPNDQLAVIDRLIMLSSVENKKYTIPHLFPYFDALLQREILKKRGIRILIVLISRQKMMDLVIQTWIYLGTFATVEDLYNVLSDLIYRHLSINPGSEYFEAALEEIWSNTPPHLKSHLLNFRFLDITRIFRGKVATFLLTILSDVDVHTRNSFWLEEWPHWFNVEPHQFVILTKLCLLNTESIEVFNRVLPNTSSFRNLCDKLISLGEHNTIDKFLNCLYSNQDQILNIKTDLLTNCVSIFQENYSLLEKHAKYIDNLFSNGDRAQYFKDWLILSEEVFTLLCRQLAASNFRTVERIVWLFASSPKRTEIQRKFLIFFHNKITNGSLRGFDESRWRQFFLWCLNDDKRLLDDFKKSLPIRDVFRAAFSKCLEFSYNLSPHFYLACWTEDLSKFFMWYCESTESFEKFVRERIDHYENLDGDEFKRSFSKNKKVVVDLMKTLVRNNDETNDHNKAAKSGNIKKLRTKSVREQKRSAGFSCSIC